MLLFSKRSQVLFLLSVFLLSAALLPLKSRREEVVVASLRSYLENYSFEMLAVLDGFKEHVNTTGKDKKTRVLRLQQHFLELRQAYKKIEPFSCYFFLASERNFNGPVVPEIEDESEQPPVIEYPHGLQVMEGYLWDDPDKFSKELKYEIELMRENLSALHIAFRTVPFDEVKIIEAIQQQVIRTFTLGIAQFDTPESKSFIDETKTTLQSLLEFLSEAYRNEAANQTIREVFHQLNRSLDFFSTISMAEDIDFLSCYRDYYVPLSKALAAVRTDFLDNNYYPPSAMRMNAPTLFQGDAFNLFFYNPRGTDPEFSSEAAALGKALFFDPVLSDNNKRSCASCHQPEQAFTDGRKTSSGFLEGETLTRNAPSLINAALQRNYFYDMRADHLEGQIGHVLTNKNEMQSSFESAVTKLRTSPEYVSWFRRAFQGKEDTMITKTSIENAISEYERTLVSLNSRFDKNIRGEENSFTAKEKDGFNVFMNKGRCATCHYLPLFNNVVPPQYTRSEFEILGTTATNDLNNPALDSDKGRGGLYGTEIFMHAFKSPTLRNIELTAPYMHNGAFLTLDEVVEFYNRGGGRGLGLDVPNQTLPADSLALTPAEKESMIAFLKTLSDTSDLTSKPGRLPSFPDPMLNKRKTGGEY